MSVAPTWIYDGSEIPDPLGYGQRAVDFIRKLRHPKSTLPRNAFQLDPWQERIVQRVYGDVDPVTGLRKIRTVYLRVGRGSRKTSLVGALMCLHLFGPEKVPGGTGIAAAVDQEQAKLTYDEAIGIIDMSPGLVRATSRKQAPDFLITHHSSRSTFRAVSSDGDSKHGKTPTIVVTDEIHAWRGRKLWAALTTGLIKVPGTLLLITTTAGAGQDGVAWGEEIHARNVAQGVVDDPAYLPIIFEIGEDDDWKDEAAWHKANPGLRHGYPDLQGLRSAALKALNDLPARAELVQYNLNRWQDAALSPWLPMELYDEGAEEIDEDALLGEPCWIGVDYGGGGAGDLTAIVASFRDGDRFIVKCWAMAAEDGLGRKAEKDQADYLRWRDEGYLLTSKGEIVDRRDLAAKLRELARLYDVQEIAFDPHKLLETMAELAEEGLPTVEFRQGWMTMGPAIDTIQEAILAGRFIHGGHPILRRHFNDVVTATGPTGNHSFHKPKSRGRIDAAVAATMAVSRAAHGEDGRSIYENEEARPGGFLILEA